MSSKNKIPDPFAPREFLGGLYHPEFIPEELDVANFLVEVDSEEKTRKSLHAKQVGVPATGPKKSTKETAIPLTEAESVEADRQIQATLDRILGLRDKIKKLRNDIDNQVEPLDSSGKKKEWRFKLDISKKRRIKQAIKKLFGVKTDTVTYGMYKEMLAAKAQLEEEQGDGYLNGFPKKKGKDKKNQKSESSNSNKKGKKDNQGGFLERGSKREDGEDEGSQNEEQYMRMFPKIGRDFVYQGDFNNQIQSIMALLSPVGPAAAGGSDTSEARKRAREYKAVLDSGEDGSKKYKDLIKLDDD